MTITLRSEDWIATSDAGQGVSTEEALISFEEPSAEADTLLGLMVSEDMESM